MQRASSRYEPQAGSSYGHALVPGSALYKPSCERTRADTQKATQHERKGHTASQGILNSGRAAREAFHGVFLHWASENGVPDESPPYLHAAGMTPDKEMPNSCRPLRWRPVVSKPRLRDAGARNGAKSNPT